MEIVFSPKDGTIVINILSYASYPSNIPSYNSAKATMYECQTYSPSCIFRAPLHKACGTQQRNHYSGLVAAEQSMWKYTARDQMRGVEMNNGFHVPVYISSFCRIIRHKILLRYDAQLQILVTIVPWEKTVSIDSIFSLQPKVCKYTAHDQMRGLEMNNEIYEPWTQIMT